MLKKIFIIIAALIFAWGSYFVYKNIGRANFLETLNGEIVYVNRDGGILNIYKISADGKNKKLLYHNEDKVNSNSMYPRWSADGTEIYFTAMKDGEWKTFVMAPNGNNVRLSEKSNDIVSYPSREIDIIGERGNLYYEEGDKRVQVYSFSNYDSKMNPGASEASWSPDRKYIVFQSCGFISGCNIIIADKEGKTAKLIKGMQPDWRQEGIIKKKSYELLCEQATEGKDDCYGDQALKNSNEELCGEIEDVSKKDTCYKNLASAKLDEKICEKITETYTKQGCYYVVALDKKEEALCERAGVYKSGCYKNFAKPEENKLVDDKIICDKISQEVTSGWNICRNEKFGFEIGYPSDWIIVNEDAGLITFADEEEVAIQKERQAGEIRCMAGVYIYNNESALSLYDWAIKKFGKPENQEAGKIGTVMIGNLEGIKYEFMSMGIQTNVLLQKEGKIIDIQTTFDGCENLNTVFNQILSTFKFITKN